VPPSSVPAFLAYYLALCFTEAAEYERHRVSALLFGSSSLRRISAKRCGTPLQ
jgi:hypothetical protein